MISSDVFYKITSINIDDIRQILTNRDMSEDDIERILSSVDEDDMKTIADKMANDYLTQLYWDSMSIIVNIVLEDKIDIDEEEE